MKKFWLLGALLTVLAACTHAPKFAEKAPQIPLKDFFKNPELSGLDISPNGQWLAYLKPYQNRMNIFVRKTDDPNSEFRVTNQLDRDISGFFWKGNQNLLFVRDFGGDENFHVFKVNINTKKEQDLTPFKETRVSILDDLDEISRNEILVQMNKRDKKIFDVYRVNIESGTLRMVGENPGNFTGWLTDHNGKIRVATSSDGVNSSVYYREAEGLKFQKLITTNFKEEFNPISFTFDNKNLYAISNLGRDKSALVEWSPQSKKETRILYQNHEVDVSGLRYSRKDKKLLYTSYYTEKNHYSFFDPQFEDHVKYVEMRLPNQEVRFAGHNQRENLWVIRTFNDRSLGAYYLYNFDNRKLDKLAEVSPWLNEKDMAEMKPISYQSRDGLTIHGYLTLPKGYVKGKLPVVINPHGGPWARDHWGFNPTIQFLANRGYAVLQMNFRGSTGYGKEFWSSSFKRWGLEMQNDITDGVNWLVSEEIANKDKICIYGGSYGGYATLAGLAFTPDVYACGIDYVGVSNIFTLIASIPPYWEPYREMFYEMIGHPENDKDLLTQVSPLFHADKIKAPLFVAQGAKDPRVKKAESDQIVDALKKRGVEVPYMVKDDEGHGFHNEENRMDFYSAMEEFLNKHLN